jgi:hypothetical protein
LTIHTAGTYNKKKFLGGIFHAVNRKRYVIGSERALQNRMGKKFYAGNVGNRQRVFAVETVRGEKNFDNVAP